jgi:hypothetical protein
MTDAGFTPSHARLLLQLIFISAILSWRRYGGAGNERGYTWAQDWLLPEWQRVSVALMNEGHGFSRATQRTRAREGFRVCVRTANLHAVAQGRQKPWARTRTYGTAEAVPFVRFPLGRTISSPVTF